MSYVDGFLVPVPTARIDEYRELARTASEVWLEHGALEYVECLAEDVQPGEHTSFPRAVMQEDGETVVFAWIRYESREHRDRVNERAMADPRLAGMTPGNMPFDGKRLIWGGFVPFEDRRGGA